MATSKWQLHVADWKNCKRCDLCERRSRVVLARGSIPCDILFVGEAPGESENVVGKPFVGPAGALLNAIIEDAIGQDTLTMAFTNLVGCIPYDEDRRKTEEPDDEAIQACAPRLQELVKLAEPRLIVCVGKLADSWLAPGFQHTIKFHKPISEKPTEGGIGRITITHPSAILRANIAQRGLMIQRCVVTIRSAIEEL